MVPVDIRDLIARGEGPRVDFRSAMAFEGDHRLELTKDIVAMANTRDGGVIIIGVAQGPQTGRLTVEGVTPEQARSFDVTAVGDFVHQRSAPPVDLSCVVDKVEGKNVSGNLRQ